MRRIAITLVAASTLAACQTESNDSADTTPDDCGAAQYGDLIGQPHTDHDFASPDRPLRIIAPNSAVTMDYRTERLNVDVDDQGRILRFWCG